MFPAIREWISDRFGSEPIGLGLKNIDGLSVTPSNIDWYARNGYHKLREVFGGSVPAHSEEPVNNQTALHHSVVWACTLRIASAQAMLPCFLQRRTPAGRTWVENDPLYNVLQYEPNEMMTSQSWRKAASATMLLRGKSYGRIIRRSGSGEVVGIYPIQPGEAWNDRDKQGRLVHVVKEGNETEKSFTVEPGKLHDIFYWPGFSFDGVDGLSIISQARHSIGNGLASQHHRGAFFARGGRMPYVLQAKNRFRNDTDFEQFRKRWEETYAEPHKAPILEGEMEYKQIGLSLADQQFVEMEGHTVPDICRWFLMDPTMIGDLSKATYNNTEQKRLEFLTLTLMDHLVGFEAAARRCLLTPEQKAAGYYVRHNVAALLRGDYETRMKGHKMALEIGLLSIDDVLEYEDMNPVANGAGRARHIQAQMQTLPGTGEPTSWEKSILAKAAAPPKETNHAD